MKALLIAALLLIGVNAHAFAAHDGKIYVKHNLFCKIEAMVRLTEAIMADDVEKAKVLKVEAIESGECQNLGQVATIEVLGAASAVTTDPWNKKFVIVRVSDKGWYTWAIQGVNTNFDFGAGA